MKNKLISFAIAATALTAQPVQAVVEGQAYPDVKVSSFNNKTLGKSDLQGKVTIINFWATWCEACKVELVEMKTEFADLFLNDKFQFAFVALDKEPQKAQDWVKEHLKDAEQFSSYLYKDPTFAAADEIEVDAFPMTLVIDQQGKVIKVQRGFKAGVGSTEELARLAGKLLD